MKTSAVPQQAPTPLRRQYLRLKKQCPDAILLFRLGDFYETFDEDAKVVARDLEITLTSREMGKGQRVPLAGIPYHALDSYLARLVKKGHKVAICEQLEDPATAKGLVERDVVRVVTPGTVIEPNLLEQKTNNYLVALVVDNEALRLAQGERRAGLAYADVSTGEFAVTQLPAERLGLEMERLSPAEVLLASGQGTSDAAGQFLPWLRLAAPANGQLQRWGTGGAGPAVTALAPEDVDEGMARERLQAHFGVATLAGFGVEGWPQAVCAAGGLLAYLQRTRRASLAQLTALTPYSTDRVMLLDPQTRRNLELFQSRSDAGRSLVAELDATETAMGGRLLRAWLGAPLLDMAALQQRQDVVQWFVDRGLARERTRKALARIGDLERLVGRVQAGAAQPRELVALRRSLEAVPELRDALGSDFPAWLLEEVRSCPEVTTLLAQAIVDDPQTALGEGGVVREGFSPEMDELRRASHDATGYLAGLETRERERAGIPTLKVGYNRVFGFYIEVTKPHLSKIPTDFIRRQTLANAERFITPELKEHEATVLGAQERMAELEAAIFKQVCAQVAAQSTWLLRTARAIAQVDVFVAFADAAVRRGYCRPRLTEGPLVHVKGGRHPVVERVLPQGTFVPNDVELGGDYALVILTGPNMGGKSTFLRQAALIVLMAQTGSFVPAAEAEVGLVDRIFTRVGLQDDLTTGMSTFMVEMVEVAQILNAATPRSLVILDEIGRGTSTYDGMAIARAVAEHLHNSPRLGCKTLFATHYHELTDLAQTLPRARNFHVSAVEDQGSVVFLHRVEPGGADRSYGVHVAQLAGLPRNVVRRAQDVLAELEAGAEQSLASKGSAASPVGTPGKTKRGVTQNRHAAQLPLLGALGEHPVMQALAELDLNGMTPLEALNKLAELQRRAMDARKKS